MSHDLFISYSSQDQAVADAMCAKLESTNIRCWVAPRDILPGTLYAEALVNAIDASKVMVLIYSASSNISPQVLNEVERAVSKGLIIVPFRIEAAPLSKSMEYFISSRHWLDAVYPPLTEHLELLVNTVRSLLPSRAVSELEPNTSASAGVAVSALTEPVPLAAQPEVQLPPAAKPVAASNGAPCQLSDSDLIKPETYAVDIISESGERIENAALRCGPRGWSSYVASMQYTRDLNLIRKVQYGPSSDRSIRFDKLVRVDFLEMNAEEKAVIEENSAYRSWVRKVRITFTDGTTWEPAYWLDHCYFETAHESGELTKLDPKSLVFRFRV